MRIYDPTQCRKYNYGMVSQYDCATISFISVNTFNGGIIIQWCKINDWSYYDSGCNVFDLKYGDVRMERFDTTTKIYV